MNVRQLIGSGDRIGLVVLPFVALAVVVALAAPGLSSVGGPPMWLGALSVVMLVPGIAIWAWSVLLILRDVPRGRLITGGPYAWVRHPLYTSVALLVLPWAGFLLGTWLGAVLGAVLYLATRRFAPAEEVRLSRTFGERWRAYDRTVRLHWL
jgi:protein-S-isoprenylcysteine O-methyltransferase Ste14